MIRKDIFVGGGEAHQCDCCEICDGRGTLYWKERDFDLCYKCLTSLYMKHLGNYIKRKNREKITVKRRVVSEDMRFKIFKKYNFKCYECGNQNNLQLDHIMPFSLGGNTEEDNLQVLCKSCNFEKRNKTYDLR